jgi:hypothetical protein
MKKILSIVVVALALTLASCATTMPLTATSNPLGSKIGEASATYLFGLFPLGTPDMGIYAAAKNGGITKISTVDFRRTPMFFVTKYSTVVSGE